MRLVGRGTTGLVGRGAMAAAPVLLLAAGACLPSDRELYGADTGEIDDGLEAEATPNAITWRWDAGALAPGAGGYVLWYGTDRAEVRAGVADEWSAANDPNLAWGSSPYGAGLVQQTTVTELEAGTRYHALLRAWLGDAILPVAFGTASTPLAPLGELAIFTGVEHQVAGAWILGFDGDPSAAARTHSGSNALWLHTTENHNPVNGQLGALGIDTRGVPATAWRDAYLELFAVLSDDARPVPYIQVHLESSNAVEYRFAYAILPVRVDWQAIQIPLSSMKSPDSDLATDMPSKIEGFLFGAHWDVEDIVWVDDVIIRY